MGDASSSYPPPPDRTTKRPASLNSYALPSYPPNVPPTAPSKLPLHHHHHHHHHHCHHHCRHHHHAGSSSTSTSRSDDGIGGVGVDQDATPIRFSPPNFSAPSISTSSISSSSYAGSADGSADGREVDLVALLTERLAGAFDPLVLDRSLAVQAQTSGMLNSKTRELIALQEEAQARLADTRRCFQEGMKVAKEVKSDLDYVHRKVKVIKQKTQRKYPVEYNIARDRIPPPSQ